MSKKTVLLKVGILIEADEADVEALSGDVDRASKAIVGAIDAALGVEDGSHLGWCSTRYVPLDREHMNCGQCAVCGGWVTDREKADPIWGLGYGAVVDGRLLCDEHLPPDHRWAFRIPCRRLGSDAARRAGTTTPEPSRHAGGG